MNLKSISYKGRSPELRLAKSVYDNFIKKKNIKKKESSSSCDPYYSSEDDGSQEDEEFYKKTPIIKKSNIIQRKPKDFMRERKPIKKVNDINGISIQLVSQKKKEITCS